MPSCICRTCLERGKKANPCIVKLLSYSLETGPENSENLAVLAASVKPDITLVTGFMNQDEGLKQRLAELGLRYHGDSSPSRCDRGILVSSRRDLMHHRRKSGGRYGYRYLESELRDENLHLLALDIPGFNHKAAKRQYWSALIRYMERRRHDDVLVMGRFNSGLGLELNGSGFDLSLYYQLIEAYGWKDACREDRKSELGGINRGFELDFAFLSPELRKKREASFERLSEDAVLLAL